MPTYMLRMTDPEASKIWDEFKARAAKEGRGRGLRFILLALLSEYVKFGLRKDK